MKFSVIISPSAISQAVIETCEALIYVLQDYMKVSQTLKCVLFKLFHYCKHESKTNQLIIIIHLLHSNILHQVKYIYFRLLPETWSTNVKF